MLLVITATATASKLIWARVFKFVTNAFCHYRTIYQHMILVTTIKFILFLVRLIGGSVDTWSAIRISLWLMIGFELSAIPSFKSNRKEMDEKYQSCKNKVCS